MKFTNLNQEGALQRMCSQFAPTPQEQLCDILEKGKKASIGEIRDWNGQKFQKTPNGWVSVRTHSQLTKKSIQNEDKQAKWDGSLTGLEEFGSPEFEEDLNLNAANDVQYMEGGEWKPERVRKVHNPIVQSFAKRGKKNPDGQKTVTLMMGAPASGKGHLRESLYKSGQIAEHVVAIDPDDIKMKGLKPDWDRFSDRNAQKAAGRVHEEGSDIAKKSFAAMEEGEFDYLQDKVFADYSKLMKEIQRLDKAGYKVQIFFAYCSKEQAQKNRQARFKKTGRDVPEHAFNSAHDNIVPTWEKLVENLPSNVVSAQRYDTSDHGKGPQLMEEYGQTK